jgi:anti-sigma-K factor RskA
MPLSHEEAKALVAPYVLGAIPSEEIPFVRTHILSCDECMAEADSYLAIASSLSLAVDEVPLPAGFADRVVAAAIGAREDRRAPVAGIRGHLSGRPRTDAKTRRRWSFVPAIAGLALILAFGVMAANVFSARGELDRNQEVLTAVLRSDKGFSFKGTSGAVAKMVPTNGGSYLAVAGLQAAPSSHDYQLWLLDANGEPTSVAVFDVDDGVAILETGTSLEGFEGAAVTIEPEGGSDQPTGDFVLTSTSA